MLSRVYLTNFLIRNTISKSRKHEILPITLGGSDSNPLKKTYKSVNSEIKPATTWFAIRYTGHNGNDFIKFTTSN